MTDLFIHLALSNITCDCYCYGSSMLMLAPSLHQQYHPKFVDIGNDVTSSPFSGSWPVILSSSPRTLSFPVRRVWCDSAFFLVHHADFRQYRNATAGWKIVNNLDSGYGYGTRQNHRVWRRSGGDLEAIRTTFLLHF